MKIRILPTLFLIAAPAMSFAEGDADNGEKVFRKCKACHQVGADAKPQAGPVLNGVVGRAVASGDFKYSTALQEVGAAGTVWTAEELAVFLEQPKKYAPGIKMAFAGLRKEADRADVIAYLATFANEGS